MTGFRFIFEDDDEGFEAIEEAEIVKELEEDEDEETPQIAEDEVIWETEED